MQLTQASLSNRLTVDQALPRLASNDLVDGLALFGSRAAAQVETALDFWESLILQ